MRINRRAFLFSGAAATAVALLPRTEAQAAPTPDSLATLIDLERCDGCPAHELPVCVQACREGRKADFPEPDKQQLLDYWPQNSHEDWSGRRQQTDRFTPYNWLFVQQVRIGDNTISIPRRCMHCDNPPCAKLCPFGVKHKTKEGPVYIDTNLCFGGGKCRDVCPWQVPQRQAGVGIYTNWQEFLPVGGGVMYKCDLCRNRLKNGQTPHCMASCPRQAMVVGQRHKIFKQAVELQQQYRGDIYGMNENGGTSTIYVSKVSFAVINEALAQQAKKEGERQLHLGKAENLLDSQRGWAWLSLLSPLVGVAAALATGTRRKKDA